MIINDFSYDEALQSLADSEAKRETAEKELKVVSVVYCILAAFDIMYVFMTFQNTFQHQFVYTLR